jgi:hypothetical protein
MKAFIRPPIQTQSGIAFLDIRFGTLNDADNLDSWSEATRSDGSTRTLDAIELATLAGKRWRYYSGRNEAASSLDDLVQRSSGTLNEIGFLLVAELPGIPHVVATAWCRRTWCNHLVLDLLATNPSYGRAQGFRHVGISMLLALAHITRRLEIPLIWGEATSDSAGFYKTAALQENRRKVQDHFFIRGKNLANLRKAATPYSAEL